MSNRRQVKIPVAFFLTNFSCINRNGMRLLELGEKMPDVHGDSEHVTVEDCAIYMGRILEDNSTFINKLKVCGSCRRIFEKYSDQLEEYFHKAHPMFSRPESGR